jgi:4-hydroxybenzoate polyprenyltransferase
VDGLLDLAKTGQAAVAAADLPLCVDMDGTLLRIDTLHEAAFAAVFQEWRVAFRLPGWLGRGKAHLKQELARRWTFDAATMPYNSSLVAYLQQQHAAGRRIVLCTAAHRDIAERVAAHLGLFDEVIATEGDANLRGPAKADLLCARFGRGGFVYAGNDAMDHVVWNAAAAAIVVNAPASVLRDVQARHKVLAIFDDRPGMLRSALRAMRPYQWVKNGLCLVPPLAAGDLSVASWGGAALISFAFCLVASSIYLFNDISDLGADRAHPRKSRRAFASGDLPVAVGIALAPLLMLTGLGLGALTGGLPALAAYVVGSLCYNIWLKEQPLVDVFVLAALYTVRLFGGGEASGHAVSLWLLGFSSFLFLSLAFVKRVSELQRLSADGGRRAIRRGYMIDDASMLEMFGTAATFASSIVLSLYVRSDTAAHAYGHPAMLWGSIPLLLFWQCRLWLSTARGYMHDDPIVYAARDWVSWVVFACLAAVVAAAWVPSVS